MLTNRLMQMDFYSFFFCFFIYSFLGWIMECVVLSLEQRRIVKDRGFIRGPFCTIYGAGAMSAYYALQAISDNVLALFLCGMFMATILEYITAVAMTKIFGCFWWDYNEKPFNYKGILCLESSIAWGLLTVLLFKVIHPLVLAFVSRYFSRLTNVLVIVLTIAYCLDFLTSFYKAFKASRFNEDENISEDDFQVKI